MAFAVGAALSLRYKVRSVIVTAPILLLFDAAMHFHLPVSVMEFMFTGAVSLFSIQIGYFFGLLLQDIAARHPTSFLGLK